VGPRWFAVVVNGVGGRLTIEERHWFVFRHRDERNMDFYTTWFVEAWSAEAAGGKALDLVRRNLTEVSPARWSDWALSVEEVREIDPPSEEEPGGGFTWYPHE